MPKFKTKDGTFNVPNVPAAISAFKKKYPDAVEIKEEKKGAQEKFGQGTAKPKSSIDPIEEEERKKYIESQPDTVVDQETYDRLMSLYEKAKKADPTGTKKTKEAKEFQIAYHKALPKEAARIISTAGKKTKKGLEEGRKWWELESNEDAYFGPRTMQYAERLKAFKPGEKRPEFTQAPGITIAKTDKKDKDVGTKPVTEKKKRYIRLGDVPAPFDVRDVINMGLAGYQYANRPAWYPFQATPNVYKENYLLSDPTRALAANAELANIASQYNQAFTGPKSGQLSGIQGTAFKNAADTLAQYDNVNRQVIDRVNSRNAAIMNAFSENQALRRTKFYDDVVRTNQQRVNEERALGTNLAGTITNALGNRAMYYNLNTLNPNFFADPRNAGMVTFTGDPTGYEPNYPSDDEYEKAYQKAKIYSPQNPWDAMKDILKIKGREDNSYNEQIARLKEAGLM